MEVTFKSDTNHRDMFFTPAHFAHPAKMVVPLLLWIVDRYTKPGDIILDPMAGCGTTMLGCRLGRNVILNELEAKFVKMCEDNWLKVQTWGPEMGCTMGECKIVQGDARQLDSVLVDAIISSPPYADINTTGKANSYKGSHGPNSQVQIPDYRETSENIGNLKGETYLAAMLEVYQVCRRILKPEGVLVLVTKNFIREQKEVSLDLDTIKLCEQAGFAFVERHHRKLTNQGFWRTIYKQKYPDAPELTKEDILVFTNQMQ